MNGISILLRAIIGIVTSKLVAIYIGPQGMAVLGNFRNFMSSVQTLGVLGMTNGVITYVSEFKSDQAKRSKLFASVFFVGCLVSLFVGCGVYFGASYWNNYVFGSDGDFQLLFKFLGMVLPFYVAQAFLLSVINGLSKYKTFILITIIGNCLYFVTAIFLILNYRLVGALYSMIITPVLLLIVTIAMLWREKFAFSIPRFSNASWHYVKNLAVFSVMTLFSGLLLPQVLIQIRLHLITEVGATEAGIWEGLQQLSNQYLLFATSLFTLYLLPKLSEKQTDRDFRKVVVHFYKNILPILGVGMLLIYFLRKQLVILLFSEDFLEMESLFVYQLLGDFLKIMALTIAYQLLAKKMLWKYLITEGISMLVIYCSSLYFVDTFGFVGVVQAHLLSYLLYLVLLVFVFRRALLYRRPDD